MTDPVTITIYCGDSLREAQDCLNRFYRPGMYVLFDVNYDYLVTMPFDSEEEAAIFRLTHL